MKAKILPLLALLTALLTFISLKVSATESVVQGNQTNANVVVNNATAWFTLSSSTVVVPAGQIWHCVANGSAEGQNPGLDNVNMRYRFVLTLDNAAPAVDGACERSLQFDDNPIVSNTNLEDVNSTCTFKNIAAGPHTFRWLARKYDASKPNLTVVDNSHSVVCSDNLIQ